MTKAVPAPPEEAHPIEQTYELLGTEASALRVGHSMRDGRVCLGIFQGGRNVTVVFDDDEALAVATALTLAHADTRRSRG